VRRAIAEGYLRQLQIPEGLGKIYQITIGCSPSSSRIIICCHGCHLLNGARPQATELVSILLVCELSRSPAIPMGAFYCPLDGLNRKRQCRVARDARANNSNFSLSTGVWGTVADSLPSVPG